MKAKRKSFLQILIPSVTLIILVVFLGEFLKNLKFLGWRSKKEIHFSTGCDDVFDPWSSLSEEEIRGICTEELNLHLFDLEEMGFKPKDCQPIATRVASCAPRAGHQLLCTYSCSKIGR